MTKQFLLEIGLEEIPAHIVTPSSKQLADRMSDFLKENRVSFENIDIFSTPRRLAVRINGLAEKQEDIEEKAKGPARKIALDADGNWSKAAQGFARGQGVDPSELFFEEFKGVEYVFLNKFVEGKPVNDVLKELDSVITKMTFPVSMHWANYDFKYIRPVHWLIALLDDELIPLNVFDVTTGFTSRGHRFLGKEAEIHHASEYETKLEEQCVIVNPVMRKHMISEQIEAIATQHSWVVPLDETLLEEVNNLVEYPTAFVGNFEEKYLDIPSEVLITSMKEHQRYFEVMDKDGCLLNHFVSVRNGNKEHIENVARGNEKVLKARLEDAEFFYQEDQKLTIESCVEKLKYVTFHEKIGSMYEKMERVSAISHLIGTSINLTEQELVDLKRASSIYKFDLVTNMVDEFPELQGVIGEKYAITQGENKAVSCAIREHYLPVSSDGVLPQSNVGAVLAIADKIDTLFTFFTVGLNPTGSNDPYALRRQTYGIIRIVENKEWSFPLIQLQHDIEKLINKDNQRFGLSIEDPKQLIHAFLKGRMKQWFSGKNLRHDIIEAVVESQQDDINQMFEIANILNENVNQDEFKGTVEALTRVINLAKKTEFKHTNDVDSHLFETKSEKELYDAVEMIKLNRADYTLNELFGVLVNLRPLINVYFDENMIMVDDEKIRNNRLSQLTDIAKLSLAFASIDRLLLK